MNVGFTLVTMFAQADLLHPQLAETWIRISHAIGSRLPHSGLSSNVQRDGKVDLVIRCIEDELSDQRAKKQNDPLVGHYLNILSAYWIGGMYETFRLLRDRKLGDSNELFRSIVDDLELICVPLEKHEIAKDKKLKKPLRTIRHPRRNDERDFYTYDPADKRRAHIMPMGMSPRGSVMWQVMNPKESKDRWIERRTLSDRILKLWGDKAVPK